MAVIDPDDLGRMLKWWYSHMWELFCNIWIDIGCEALNEQMKKSAELIAENQDEVYWVEEAFRLCE